MVGVRTCGNEGVARWILRGACDFALVTRIGGGKTRADRVLGKFIVTF